MKHTLLIHYDLWADLKKLRKTYKGLRELKNDLDENAEIDDAIKFRGIPLFKAITDFLSNVCSDSLENYITPYDYQPYISDGWIIYKVRYGIANLSKRDGLRIIFLENKENSALLMIIAKSKNECADESELRQEIEDRLKDYFQR